MVLPAYSVNAQARRDTEMKNYKNRLRETLALLLPPSFGRRIRSCLGAGGMYSMLTSVTIQSAALLVTFIGCHSRAFGFSVE